MSDFLSAILCANFCYEIEDELGFGCEPGPGVIAQCSPDQLAHIISGNRPLPVLVLDQRHSVLEAVLAEKLGSDASSTGLNELEFTEVSICGFLRSPPKHVVVMREVKLYRVRATTELKPKATLHGEIDQSVLGVVSLTLNAWKRAVSGCLCSATREQENALVPLRTTTRMGVRNRHCVPIKVALSKPSS